MNSSHNSGPALLWFQRITLHLRRFWLDRARCLQRGALDAQLLLVSLSRMYKLEEGKSPLLCRTYCCSLHQRNQLLLLEVLWAGGLYWLQHVIAYKCAVDTFSWAPGLHLLILGAWCLRRILLITASSILGMHKTVWCRPPQDDRSCSSQNQVWPSFPGDFKKAN